ncbi:ribonucleotide-diphosphate reductase subunit beta [Bdellovibrio sp. BCCA]|uniref:ribonucleotide-diphosphate reductase subunit beta n=1 Tax=Bdellovibrio sp. BCCA TaxID=3136281 RepID=UPI0030F242EE
MKYPLFYEMYETGIKNTWHVGEISFETDIKDLRGNAMTDRQKHLIKRLVAFFATGDTIVSNNLVLNLYKHINSPEARMYLSRQLFEESVHIQFYLTLLDNYIPDPNERSQAFAAIENIPSIKKKADFAMKWIDNINDLSEIKTDKDRRQFLLNLICFAACIEGLFFYAAFAYVYFLRSKGLLAGLASGTNWVFRDETCHMDFAFAVIRVAKKEYPGLFDEDLIKDVKEMLAEAIECEMAFAEDVLKEGLTGMSMKGMREYLEYCADQRFTALGIGKIYNTKNPFSFMALQDVQPVTNFFERKVAEYQVGMEGKVTLEEDF